MTDVAICFNDASGSYYKNALVTAASVLDNTRSKVCLHLVHDESLSDTAREAFSSLFAQYGQELRLYRADTIPEAAVSNLPPSFGKGSLYRAMLPSFLAADRVLYLDCDIVCLADVADIYAQDISGHFFAAVKMSAWQAKKWIKRYAIQADFCVNSGVLLMNLEKIRSEMPEYSARLIGMAADESVRACDQGALNLIFNPMPGAYLFLPEDCNFRTELGDHATWPLARYRGKVLHFAGKKPWQVLTQPALFYWKYYSRLFPSEDVFEQMEKLEPYEQAYLFSFILGNDGRRRRLRREYEIATQGLWNTIKKRLLR